MSAKHRTPDVGPPKPQRPAGPRPPIPSPRPTPTITPTPSVPTGGQSGNGGLPIPPRLSSASIDKDTSRLGALTLANPVYSSSSTTRPTTRIVRGIQVFTTPTIGVTELLELRRQYLPTRLIEKATAGTFVSEREYICAIARLLVTHFAYPSRPHPSKTKDPISLFLAEMQGPALQRILPEAEANRGYALLCMRDIAETSLRLSHEAGSVVHNTLLETTTLLTRRCEQAIRACWLGVLLHFDPLSSVGALSSSQSSSMISSCAVVIDTLADVAIEDEEAYCRLAAYAYILRVLCDKSRQTLFQQHQQQNQHHNQHQIQPISSSSSSSLSSTPSSSVNLRLTLFNLYDRLATKLSALHEALEGISPPLDAGKQQDDGKHENGQTQPPTSPLSPLSSSSGTSLPGYAMRDVWSNHVIEETEAAWETVTVLATSLNHGGFLSSEQVLRAASLCNAVGSLPILTPSTQAWMLHLWSRAILANIAPLSASIAQLFSTFEGHSLQLAKDACRAVAEVRINTSFCISQQYIVTHGLVDLSFLSLPSNLLYLQ